MKRGQGLSLNTIIIAAIVLIVLVVLWAIFTGKMGKFTLGLKEQEELAKEEAKKFGSIATDEKTVEPGSEQKCPRFGAKKCKDNRIVQCERDGTWVTTENCGKKGERCIEQTSRDPICWK